MEGIPPERCRMEPMAGNLEMKKAAPGRLFHFFSCDNGPERVVFRCARALLLEADRDKPGLVSRRESWESPRVHATRHEKGTIQ
jgi:hypothetical protein